MVETTTQASCFSVIEERKFQILNMGIHCRIGISIIGGRAKGGDDHFCKILPNCLVSTIKSVCVDLVVPLWGRTSKKVQKKGR